MTMSVLDDAVTQIMTQSGAVSCAIVDIETGECLSRYGVAVTGMLEAAALVNARMLRAKLRMVSEHHNESIEDILITLGRHYHIIRLVRGGQEMPTLFLYLVLDRPTANLAMARHKLALIEHDMFQTPEAIAKLEAVRARAMGNDRKLHGGIDGFGPDNEDDLPAFMRDDVALKILGINADEEIREF